MSKRKPDAWEFIRHMKQEWTEEDWSDFYHAVDGALKKIAKRHRLPPEKTSDLLTVTKLGVPPSKENAWEEGLP